MDDRNRENRASGSMLPSMTRRLFLKTAGVTAGAAAFAGSSLQAYGATYDIGAQQVETAEEKIYRGVCRGNCFGYCHLNVHVRDGKVVKTSKAPYTDERWTRVCHRGLSHVQRIYDSDRLQYPLRRVAGSERGAGQWERISWDEALDELVSRIKKDQADFGPQALATYSGSTQVQLLGYCMYARLWNLLQPTAVSLCTDMGLNYGIARMTGPLSNMWEGNDASDMENAKTIVLWGCNVTDSEVQTWHFIKEAMQKGTKLVVVDPTYTYAASKADLWIPIRPGADMPLYMGIMHEVVERGKVDTDYLAANTVAPFLVRSDNGKFLRGSDLGQDPVHTGQMSPLTQEEIIVDEYITIQKGKPTGNLSATAPDLTAEYEFKGIKCRTAYSLLLDEIEKFPLETVSELTEIPVDTITQLAEICMDGPVFHHVGYGPQARSNGHHAHHAGMTMAALTGNLGKPGATYGNCWYMYFGFDQAFAAPTGAANPTPGISINDMPSIVESGTFQGNAFPIKDLIVYYGNPLSMGMNVNKLKEMFNNLEFVCTIDSTMTDTCRYSDLVLPAAQWFEQTDVTFGGQTLCLSYNEKAIEPLYESKPDPEIVRMIADKFGFSDYFKEGDEEILDRLLDTPTGKALGISYSRIKEEGDVRFVAKTPYVAYEGGTAAGAFSTPSGRLEFYLENPLPQGVFEAKVTPELIERERLPHWYPPAVAWSDNDIAKEYPIVLMSERPRYRVHTQWYNVRALRELDPEPFIKLNPVDAEARGLADNSYVECFNEHGSCVAKLHISNAIRPGTAVYPKGWQEFQHKVGSWSSLISNQYDPFCANANFMDAMCEVRAWKE